MPKYYFTYGQLIETYNQLTVGKIEPTRMLMSTATFTQFRDWASMAFKHGGDWIHTHPMCFQAAMVEIDNNVADGCIIFVGGAHVLKLTEIPDGKADD